MRRALLAVFLVSCSGSTDAAPASEDAVATNDAVSSTDSADVDSATPVDDTGSDGAIADAPMDTPDPFGAYPAGPYGNAVGNVMPNLAWEGWVNVLADAISTTKPYVAKTDLDTLRRSATKGYGLVHVSEFY